MISAIQPIFALAPLLVCVQQNPATTAAGPCDSNLAKQIPGAMVFVHCPDVREWSKRVESLAISRLFEDEEVKEFLGGKAQLEQAMQQFRTVMPNMPEELFKQVVDMVQNGFQGELSFAMTQPRVVAAGGAKEPEIYFSGFIGDSGAKFDSTMAALMNFVRTTHGETAARRVAEDSISYYEFKNNESDDSEFAEGIRIGRSGKNVYFAGPRANAITRVMGAAPDVPLAMNPSFREACDLFTRRPGSIYLYLDGLSILDSSPNTRRDLAPMGLDRLKWIGFSMEPDGDVMRHRLEVRADATNGIATLFTEKAKFDLAEQLPATTVFVMQMAMNGEATRQSARKIVNMSGERAANNMNPYDRRMRLMRERVGTDLDEMLSLVGDEVALGVVMPDAGIIPDVYLLLRAKSASDAGRLATLVEVAARQSGGNQYSLGTTKYKNRTVITTEAREGPSPAMVVEGDTIVVASSLFSLKRWIQFREDPTAPRLSDAKNYKDSMGALAGEPATAYVWTDWSNITRFVYGNFAQIGPMLFGARAMSESMDEADEEPASTLPNNNSGNKSGQKGAAHELHTNRSVQIAPGLKVNWSKLPTSETIARYITPQTIRIRVNTNGLSLESRAIF